MPDRASDDAPTAGPSDPSRPTSSRRSVMKGAAGAAAAAAVWSAPRLEGLSVVPDYAAAGTASTPVISFRLNGNGPTGFFYTANFMDAAPSPLYTINADGPSTNVTIQMTAPLGPAGNAVFTFPSGQEANALNAVNATVTFNVDPPFNRCIVLGTTAGWSTENGVFRGNTTATTTANQSPNTTSPRAIPLSFPPGNSIAPFFSGVATRLDSLVVNVQCV